MEAEVRQADTIAMIGTELAREFGEAMPAGIIASAVVEAVHDLRGSICADALPEMAVRLVRVRLGEKPPPISESNGSAGRNRSTSAGGGGK